MITALTTIAQAILIFTLGYQTAKIRRRIADDMFRDELYSRILDKIRNDYVIIDEEKDTPCN